MAIKYGFYGSLGEDKRIYKAEDFTKIFDGVIQDGVFQTIGDCFLVTQTDGESRNAYVKTGKAWLDHTYTTNDSLLTITFDELEDSSLSRIDAVVIDVNTNTRQNDIIIVKGTEASTPAKPTLVTTAGHNQYAVAYVTLKGSESGYVKNANIENNVGVNNNVDPTHPVLPYVIGAMQIMSPIQAVQQLEAQIENWFEHLQDELDENQAAHLQNEIDGLIIIGADPLTDIQQFGTNGKLYIQYEENEEI